MRKLELIVCKPTSITYLRHNEVQVPRALAELESSPEPSSPLGGLDHALARLNTLGTFPRECVRFIKQVAKPLKTVRPGADLPDPANMKEPILIVSGWASVIRRFPDGGKQLIKFLLPGDFVHSAAPGWLEVAAITQVELCRMPAERPEHLDKIMEVSRLLHETYLYTAVVRNGRMTAEEGIADLLLEFYDRLKLANLVQGLSFAFPIKQELLAAALGMNQTHVHRSVTKLRERDITWENGRVAFCDPDDLAARVRHTWIGVKQPVT